MTRGEEKVVSEVGDTSMLPGNEHRPGAQTKGGRADPPLAHTQKSRCCGPGRRPPDAAQSSGRVPLQRGDRHSLTDPQKALPLLGENKGGTLKNCTEQKPG